MDLAGTGKVLGVAALICCLSWAFSICPLMVSAAGSFGGGRPPEPLAQHLDRMARRAEPTRFPVTLVVLRKPTPGAGPLQTHAIPPHVADRVFCVGWVDEQGLWRGEDYYFREQAPVAVQHAGQLASYQNFFEEYKARA